MKLPCKGKVTVCLLRDSDTNLEESAWTLVLPDLSPAVHCALDTFCLHLLSGVSILRYISRTLLIKKSLFLADFIKK